MQAKFCFNDDDAHHSDTNTKNKAKFLYCQDKQFFTFTLHCLQWAFSWENKLSWQVFGYSNSLASAKETLVTKGSWGVNNWCSQRTSTTHIRRCSARQKISFASRYKNSLFFSTYFRLARLAWYTRGNTGMYRIYFIVAEIFG